MRRYCRKASANVLLFFELQNIFHFFFKKSTKNLIFSFQTPPKARKNSHGRARLPTTAFRTSTTHLRCKNSERRAENKTSPFFIPSRILFSRFSAKIQQTNESPHKQEKQIRIFSNESRRIKAQPKHETCLYIPVHYSGGHEVEFR